jgi:hypothetical protein
MRRAGRGNGNGGKGSIGLAGGRNRYDSRVRPRDRFPDPMSATILTRGSDPEPPVPESSEIRSLLGTAARRLGLERFLLAVHRLAIIAAGLAVGLAALDRIGGSAFVPWWPVAGGLAAGVLAAAWILQRRGRPSELQVASLVDERLGLRDRLSNAVQAAGIEGPVPRLVVAEGVATARDPRVREALGRRFVVRSPRRAWIAPLLVVLVVGVLQLPQADLLAADPPDGSDPAAVEAAREEAIAAMASVSEVLADSPQLAEQLGDLAEELALPEDLAVDLDDPEALRREAIKRLTRTNERLEQLLAGEQAMAMKRLESMMSELESGEGMAGELASALREGDFEAAAEALERMMQQLDSEALDPEAREQLASELGDLAEQLEQLAAQQEEMARRLAEAGLDPQLASNPQAMQQAIEQSSALNQQQKQQLMQQMQAMQQASEMASQMGGACRSMGQAMASGGQTGRGAGQLSEQLSDLESMQQMLAQARSMLAQGQGQCQSMGMYSGDGRMSPGSGSNRGAGGGANPVEATAAATVDRRAEATMREGEVIARMLVDGEPITGESKAVLREAVRAAGAGVDDAVEQSPLPRRYHESLKHYFGRLATQVESAPVRDAAASPAPRESAGAGTGGDS